MEEEEFIKKWIDPTSEPKHTLFPVHGQDVVTSLLFDKEKIITGSDDHTIAIHDIHTGQLRTKFEGHNGGVWSLDIINGNRIVSGSTDKTVRVWNIEQERCTHIFYGHTSTVRCVNILRPLEAVAPEPDEAEIAPKEPLIVTGSRDCTLGVWQLPNEKDEDYLPSSLDEAVADPFFVRRLTGHTHNVRQISCHGKTVVSGSYDKTVRVWNVYTGECQWVFTGHNQRVYSVVLDSKYNRCISGSMDQCVKMWCLDTGSLLLNLDGHTSLVGLLSLSPSTIVSAAADGLVIVWRRDTGELLHKLEAHNGAVTCFDNDDHKIVSGSERTLKLWNKRTGQLVRNLLEDVDGTWQVKFDDFRCIAASKRGKNTYLEVIDFDS
jgi:F-box and WD-40 domain protein CDC4